MPQKSSKKRLKTLNNLFEFKNDNNIEKMYVFSQLTCIKEK